MDAGAREAFLGGLPLALAAAGSGASPAYDVTERGGDVVELEILLADG